MEHGNNVMHDVARALEYQGKCLEGIAAVHGDIQDALADMATALSDIASSELLNQPKDNIHARYT